MAAVAAAAGLELAPPLAGSLCAGPDLPRLTPAHRKIVSRKRSGTYARTRVQTRETITFLSTATQGLEMQTSRGLAFHRLFCLTFFSAPSVGGNSWLLIPTVWDDRKTSRDQSCSSKDVFVLIEQHRTRIETKPSPYPSSSPRG